MAEDKADEIMLKLVGDNMTLILEIDISNLRYATLKNIYSRLTGTGYQLKLYNKMISNYASFESKGIGQKREFEFLKSIALKYLNAPEQEGGKTPFGIDAMRFLV